MPTTPSPPPVLDTSLGEPLDLADFYTDFEHHYHQASESDSFSPSASTSSSCSASKA